MTRILVMSNIHGRYDEMIDILLRVGKDTALPTFDRIIFMGDYIDFGKKNKEVLKFLMKFNNKTDKVIVLKGNWEDILHQVERGETREIRDEAFQFFVQYGQVEALRSLREDKELLKDWLDAIEQMPTATIEGDYFISHAGLNMHLLGETDTYEEFFSQVHDPNFVWMLGNEHSYLEFLQICDDPDDFPFKIIMGQTAINKILGEDKSAKYDQPLKIENLYCVDFGAIYANGRLGAVVFDNGEVKTYTKDVVKYKKETKTEKPKEEKTIQGNTSGKHTTEITWEMYQRGLNVKEIAKERGFKEETIRSHLIDLYQKGKHVDITLFYREQHVDVVLEALKKHGIRDLKIIKDIVPKEVSYSEIKAIGAKYKVS